MKKGEWAEIVKEEEPEIGDYVKAWDNEDGDFAFGELLNKDVIPQYPYELKDDYFKHAKRITVEQYLKVKNI